MSVVSLFSFRCSPWRTTAQILSCTVHLQEWPGTSYSEMPQGNSKKKKMPYVRTRDQLKIVAGEMKPKEALHHVINRWPWWSTVLCGIKSGSAKSTASKRYGKA